MIVTVDSIFNAAVIIDVGQGKLLDVWTVSCLVLAMVRAQLSCPKCSWSTVGPTAQCSTWRNAKGPSKVRARSVMEGADVSPIKIRT